MEGKVLIWAQLRRLAKADMELHRQELRHAAKRRQYMKLMFGIEQTSRTIKI